MAKRKLEKNLKLALDFRDLLLFQITYGNMGVEPKNPIVNDTATFAEKKGFLDAMLKAADMVRRSEGDDDVESGFDLIRKQINGSGASRSKGNPWNPGEGVNDEGSGEAEDIDPI